jgi:hypothetical protein
MVYVSGAQNEVFPCQEGVVQLVVMLRVGPGPTRHFLEFSTFSLAVELMTGFCGLQNPSIEVSRPSE